LDGYYGSSCGLEGDHECFRSFRILNYARRHYSICA
jgi:hypothetical protein